MLTTQVENFPGFPEGILGPELMQRMKNQAERLGAQVVLEDAKSVNLESNPFKVQTSNNIWLGRSLIIATGAVTRWLDAPGV